MAVVEPSLAIPGLEGPRRRSLLASLWANPSGRVGCVLAGIVVVAAISGAVGLTPYPAQSQNPVATLKGPSFAHLLGTDQFGRDMFSLVLQGLYVSLKISCVAVAIAGVLGTLGGIVAGYSGRWVSAVIMRATDMLFAIPAILLALAIVTALGAGWFNSALAIGIGYIPIFVRVVRGPVLALREAGYVRAGRVLGFSPARLLFRHILPNVAGIVAVQTSLALAWAVLAEATLSFLGLGPPAPTASLGEMVYNSTSQSLAATAWWTLAGPSLAVVIAVIGFNFLGDGLRDAIDPRGALVEEAELRVIGMISGTSFDAVEALLVELELDGEVLVCDLVEHRSVPYPSATRDAIAALLPPATSTIEQVCRLDVEIGQFFATVAKGLVDRHGPVHVVCSHGQTVYHWVEGDVARGTLQLGEPAWTAELTGAAVVSDVRNRDIACGGHGAPLASLLDVLLLGSNPSATSGSLNLGGIANVTVVGPERPPIAFDIGPANALMDAVVQALTEGEETFDRDGALAAQGHPVKYLVDRLLDDPYFSLPPPKSTGKEYFNFGYVSNRLPDRSDIAVPDLLASLTVASAEMVARALRPFHLHELVAAGGGTRNPVLMGELEVRLPGVPVRRIDDLGVPEAAKEALVFAVIGFLTLCGIPATIPSCTGATKASVLGCITPGAGPLPLPPAQPAGPPATPTRLLVRTPLPAR